MVLDADTDLDAPFTMGEFQAALHQGKAHSAIGHDGVTSQHLLNFDESARLILFEMVNTYCTLGDISDDLKLTLLHPLPKPNTPLCLVLTNLRPILLTPTIRKLIERLINNHLEYQSEYVRLWFHPSQTGFSPHLNTIDCLWLLRRVLNHTLRAGNTDCALTFDVGKEFDNVSQEAIFQELAVAVSSQRAQNWIRNFLENRPIRLNSTHPGWRLGTFYLDRAVPQGSAHGPVLFNLTMACVAPHLERDTAARFAIPADDLTAWVEAADCEFTEVMATEL